MGDSPAGSTGNRSEDITMRVRHLVVFAVLGLSVAGCGGEEENKNVLPKEKYDAVWRELTDAMAKKKGKVTLKDQEALLKKNNIDRAAWKVSIDKYGTPQEVLDKQREIMTGGMKKSNGPAEKAGGTQ